VQSTVDIGVSRSINGSIIQSHNGVRVLTYPLITSYPSSDLSAAPPHPNSLQPDPISSNLKNSENNKIPSISVPPCDEDREVFGVLQVFLDVSNNNDGIEEVCMDIIKILSWTLCNSNIQDVNVNYVLGMRDKLSLLATERDQFESLKDVWQRKAAVNFCICIYGCKYASKYLYSFIYIYMYTYIFVHIYVYTHIHIHKYQFKYMNINIFNRIFPLSSYVIFFR
jgi:hypothetical protein